MAEIEKLFESAPAVTGFSGIFALLLACFILVLLIHGTLQVAALCVCFARREWLAWIFDPDNFPKGSVWQERAARLMALLDRVARPEPSCAQWIISRTRSYHLTAGLATGDLCDVHYALSAGRPFVLKTARVSGCDSLLAKERMLLHQLQEQSGGDLYGEYFPAPTESFRSGNRLVSAFEWREGFFPAAEVLRRYPRGVDGRQLAWMFNRTLEALGFVHNLGWIHGAVLPPHLLFQAASHGLQLVGWIHAERRNTPLRLVPRKFRAWYPRECHRREVASPATDIYLATKSMIWLAGGNPLTNSMPDQLSNEVRRVLQECLRDSPSQRPQDAWALHERFREVLEGVYGLPQFCHLNM